MGPKRIIAITGRKGSGKNTLAHGLKQRISGRGDLCAILPYGIPIRRIAALVCSLSIQDFMGPRELRDKINTGWLWSEVNPKLVERFPNHGVYITASEMLQLIAEEVFRETFSTKTWIRMMEADLVDSYRDDIIIIPDLRKLAEVESLRRWPLVILKVINPDNNGNHDSHSTEAEIDQIPADYLYYAGRSRSPEQVENDIADLETRLFDLPPAQI